MNCSRIFHIVRVIRVIDGDTIDCEIDLGFDIKTTQRLRLARIDAPEKRGTLKPSGLASELACSDFLDAHDNISVTTLKKDSFGRYIAEIESICDGEIVNLSDFLVAAKMAVYREY